MAHFLRNFISAALLAASLCWASIAGAAPVLQVAAAADLASCIEELGTGFARSVGGVEVKNSIGSSGNFFAQIKNGAPFDVFLSADMHYPRELAKADMADLTTLMVYAHGRLMMWTNNPAIDVSVGLRVLRNPKINRIAIANPDVAPYGRAAKAVLQHAGLWESLKSKLVFGDNVAQTAQFVETGNAQVGFVGIAHIKAAGAVLKGSAWQVPIELAPSMEQGAIVTAKGKTNPLAAKYLDFLRSDTGRAILRKYGFFVPEAGG